MNRRAILKAILVCVLVPTEELAKARKTGKTIPTPTTEDQFLVKKFPSEPQNAPRQRVTTP